MSDFAQDIEQDARRYRYVRTLSALDFKQLRCRANRSLGDGAHAAVERRAALDEMIDAEIAAIER